MQIQTIAKISLIIFLYYIVYGVYVGILHPIPAQGDSFDYHIPISQSILNGTFLNLHNVKLPQWYYPGSSEAINSLFILLHIPLTLSNIFAIIVLIFSCWKLAKIFKLDYFYALLFATTFCTLNVVIRWLNAVSIDIWVAVFFVWVIILLEQPKKTIKYFLKLGFVCGMLIGSKYTACIFLLILFLSYAKAFRPFLNIPRIIVFFIPFSIFGLFWYIRNYLLLSNPFYPLSYFGFKGTNVFDNLTIISVGLRHPGEMFNALFGEYKLWFLCLIIPLIFFVYKYVLKKTNISGVEKLFLIGLINAIFFTQFPTSNQPWIMVSSFRYSYPIFIPLMLGTFILAKKYKLENFLGYFAIGNMIMVTSFIYFPKLVIFYIPLAILLFYLLDKANGKKITFKN